MAIDGTWTNIFGSILTLATNGNSLTGTFQIAGGSPSPLIGFINTDAEADPAVGWVVLGQTGTVDGVTSWAGQYYSGANPSLETIIAIWLLHSETPGQPGITQVGQDIYGRTS